MADEVLDFLKGFSTEDYDLDLGIQFVDADPGEATVTSEAVEAIGTKVENLSGLETKVNQLQSTLSGIKALLDFDELNIEGKLDVIINKLNSDEQTQEATPAVDMTATETKLDHLIQEQYQILSAIGDPEERKAEIERRLGEAIDNHKEKLDEKLTEIEKLTLPLLINLIKPESLEQKYIFWPNRKEIIERQIKRILQITRGDQTPE